MFNNIDSNSKNIFLQKIIHTFDLGKNYQYLIINFLDSPNVNINQLDINYSFLENNLSFLILIVYCGNFEILKKLILLNY